MLLYGIYRTYLIVTMYDVFLLLLLNRVYIKHNNQIIEKVTFWCTYFFFAFLDGLGYKFI